MAKNKKTDKKEEPVKKEKAGSGENRKKEKLRSGKKAKKGKANAEKRIKKEKSGAAKKAEKKAAKVSRNQLLKAEAKAKKEALRLASEERLRLTIEKLNAAFSDLKTTLGDKAFGKLIQKAGKILSDAVGKKQ